MALWRWLVFGCGAVFGIIVPAWNAFKWLIGWGEHIEFIAHRVHDIHYVGPMLEALLNPPPWLPLASVPVGLFLIWLALRRGKGPLDPAVTQFAGAMPPAQNEFSNDIPDVRIADDTVASGLFETSNGRDKLIPLLEAGKLIAWGRLGNGNPAPTKIPADQWATHYLDNRPADSPGRINQTYFRPRSRPYESTYYDVHLNRGQLKRVWPGLWESPPSLVDAESIRLAGVVGAVMEATLSWSFKLPLPAGDIWIRRYNELKVSAHPIWTDDRVRQLRIEFLHYCGIVGQPLGDAREVIDNRKKLYGFGRQLISILKGEQLAEDKGDNGATSIDRIPCTELLKMATDRGWDFLGHDSLHLMDLQDAIRQGGSDNHLTVWGRLKRWSNESLLRNEILEKIPAEHWRAFYVHLWPACDGDNFYTKSWTPSDTPQNYLDLHVDRREAAAWLDREAASFRGKRKPDQRGMP